MLIKLNTKDVSQLPEEMVLPDEIPLNVLVEERLSICFEYDLSLHTKGSGPTRITLTATSKKITTASQEKRIHLY